MGGGVRDEVSTTQFSGCLVLHSPTVWCSRVLGAGKGRNMLMLALPKLTCGLPTFTTAVKYVGGDGWRIFYRIIRH